MMSYEIENGASGTEKKEEKRDDKRKHLKELEINVGNVIEDDVPPSYEDAMDSDHSPFPEGVLFLQPA